MPAESMGARAPRLVAADLSVHFGDRSALEGITVSFFPGETVSLLGPNGAGKSTLLKVIGGLLPASHGTVALNGTPIRRPSHAVVYVPQRSSVDWTFPVSVLDVVLMARALRRSRLLPYGEADRAAALQALAQVGMRQMAPYQIGALSGGQQQRVFLARALVQDGEVFLLDEPFTGVDVPTQELVVSLFRQLRERGKTIIYATHDLDLAARSSDRIMLLNRRLIAIGAPREVLTAANLRATFGGQAVLPFDVLGAGEMGQ